MLSNRVFLAGRQLFRKANFSSGRSFATSARNTNNLLVKQQPVFSAVNPGMTRYGDILNKYSGRPFATVAKKRPAQKDDPLGTMSDAEAERVKAYRRNGWVMAWSMMAVATPVVYFTLISGYFSRKAMKEDTIQYKGAYNNLGTFDDVHEDLARRYKTKTIYRVLKDDELHAANLAAEKSKYHEGENYGGAKNERFRAEGSFGKLT